MSDVSLDTVIRKHTGLSEKELQAATWEEIDTMAQKRNGVKPSFQRSSHLFYPGSVYVMMGRFGSLDESRERWEKIGGDK
jgi:hypothetical protein